MNDGLMIFQPYCYRIFCATAYYNLLVVLLACEISFGYETNKAYDTSTFVS